MKRSLTSIGSAFFDQTKQIRSDGVLPVWRGLGQDYHSDSMLLAGKHGVESVLWWGCMSATDVGEMTFILWMASLRTQIWNEETTPCLNELGRRGIFQHDTDPEAEAEIFCRLFTIMCLSQKHEILHFPLGPRQYIALLKYLDIFSIVYVALNTRLLPP